MLEPKKQPRACGLTSIRKRKRQAYMRADILCLSLSLITAACVGVSNHRGVRGCASSPVQ